jgi:Sensors of blue-light using FAD
MVDSKEKIYFITYFSSARKKFSDDELHSLLKNAREYNTKVGVTGMLMYYDGSFVQVLEGNKEAVNEVFERINKDNRHYQIIKIKEGFEIERVFDEWSMAFYSFRNEDFLNQDGFKRLVYHELFSDTKIDMNNPIIIVLKSFFEAQPLYRKLHN